MKGLLSAPRNSASKWGWMRMISCIYYTSDAMHLTFTYYMSGSMHLLCTYYMSLTMHFYLMLMLQIGGHYYLLFTNKKTPLQSLFPQLLNTDVQIQIKGHSLFYVAICCWWSP